ncbi:Ankyrin-3 [Penicillium chrysogenum]|uniref:Ankyrin-3 n=1 Tax=Penicillium chrysogenum TaxID=5076 RepID=A0A167QAT4_PENCH|nr:Ankyrin-3 [Penicillium chrysogenum]
MFSDIQFSPGASEYNQVDPATPEQLQSDLSSFTMDALLSTNPAKVGPSLCANCYAHTKPQFLPRQDLEATITLSTNTTTQPLGQHTDHNPACASGAGSKVWTTPLHISVAHGHLWAVHLLLDHGADPNAIDGSGSTVLHTAVRRGHHTIVRELLRYNADPSSVDVAGWLPLHYAAEAGDENCMRALLQTA